jgi:hypothetical protein
MPMSARWCLNRLFEWVMTAALLGVGLHLMIWPQAVAAGEFRYLLNIVGPLSIMSVMLAVGWFRMLALVANGHWPVLGPRVRALSAFAAAVIWVQMDLALVKLALSTDASPSLGIPLCAALFIGEVAATFMAAADDRSKLR